MRRRPSADTFITGFIFNTRDRDLVFPQTVFDCDGLEATKVSVIALFYSATPDPEAGQAVEEATRAEWSQEGDDLTVSYPELDRLCQNSLFRGFRITVDV